MQHERGPRKPKIRPPDTLGNQQNQIHQTATHRQLVYRQRQSNHSARQHSASTNFANKQPLGQTTAFRGLSITGQRDESGDARFRGSSSQLGLYMAPHGQIHHDRRHHQMQITANNGNVMTAVVGCSDMLPFGSSNNQANSHDAVLNARIANSNRALTNPPVFDLTNLDSSGFTSPQSANAIKQDTGATTTISTSNNNRSIGNVTCTRSFGDSSSKHKRFLSNGQNSIRNQSTSPILNNHSNESPQSSMDDAASQSDDDMVDVVSLVDNRHTSSNLTPRNDQIKDSNSNTPRSMLNPNARDNSRNQEEYSRGGSETNQIESCYSNGIHSRSKLSICEPQSRSSRQETLSSCSRIYNMVGGNEHQVHPFLDQNPEVNQYNTPICQMGGALGTYSDRLANLSDFLTPINHDNSNPMIVATASPLTSSYFSASHPCLVQSSPQSSPRQMTRPKAAVTQPAINQTITPPISSTSLESTNTADLRNSIFASFLTHLTGSAIHHPNVLMNLLMQNSHNNSIQTPETPLHQLQRHTRPPIMINGRQPVEITRKISLPRISDQTISRGGHSMTSTDAIDVNQHLAETILSRDIPISFGNTPPTSNGLATVQTIGEENNRISRMISNNNRDHVSIEQGPCASSMDDRLPSMQIINKQNFDEMINKSNKRHLWRDFNPTSGTRLADSRDIIQVRSEAGNTKVNAVTTKSRICQDQIIESIQVPTTTTTTSLSSSSSSFSSSSSLSTSPSLAINFKDINSLILTTPNPQGKHMMSDVAAPLESLMILESK